MKHYRISPLAEQDMEAIGDFIAQDNPHRALTFIAELRNQCTKVAASPKAFCLRPELGNDIRSCAYGNYVIFFQESTVELCIVRVLHGAMDIDNRFSEK
jgi:toxin ParE1/3/4